MFVFFQQIDHESEIIFNVLLGGGDESEIEGVSNDEVNIQNSSAKEGLEHKRQLLESTKDWDKCVMMEVNEVRRG